MSPAPNVQDLIDTVHRDAPTRDPLDLLSTASATAAQISNAGDALIDHFVDGARRAGLSWAEISSVLGVTKQAVHKRFALVTEDRDLERFTGRARLALDAADDISRGFGHWFIGTEHLLLGLAADPDSLAGKVLARAKITRESLEAGVLERFPRRADVAPDTAPIPESARLPYTRLARQVLVGTLDEAMSMGHNYVGTEHMLLAEYCAPDGLGVQLLLAGGLDRDTARAHVVELLARIQTGRRG
jgi:hypothetical protein